MKKTLVFYWYVPSFFWHEVYDLHLKNLALYKDVFDYILFAISVDENSCDVDETINRIKSVVPNANFVVVENNKEQRESKFFYDSIISSIGSATQEGAIFFAHNKGVESTYMPNDERDRWINTMYYFNLRNQGKIDEMLSDEKTIVIGTAKIVNYTSIGFAWCEHKWHYTGTFYWIVPNRLNKWLADNSIVPMPVNGRYYAEGFWGTLFNDDADECKCVGGIKRFNERFDSYIKRVATPEELEDFIELYEKTK